MQIFKNIIFFIVFVILTLNAFGLTDSLKFKWKRPINNDNVEKINTTFIFRPFYINQSTKLSFSVNNSNGRDIIYNPNANGSVGFGINFYKIGLSFSVKIPNSTEKILKYGNTDYTNIRLTYNTRRIGINLFYLGYTGFYLANPVGIEPNWNYSLPFPKRNDIDCYSIGFYTHLIWSDKFSYKAAFSQTERQKKSAGSLILIIADRFTRLKNDSSFIPGSEQQYYQDIKSLKKGFFNTVNIAPGYAYSIIYKYFNFTNILAFGVGFQQQIYEIENNTQFNVNIPYFFNFKSSLGYNSKKYFANITYTADVNNIPIKQTNIKINYPSFEIGAGVRF
jgi:hypothetical protein